MRKIIIPAFFVAILGLGYWLTMESWNGNVYVYLGEQRAPAAVRSIKDYSSVDRRQLSASLNQQLLKTAKLQKLNGYMGVTLGHPLLKRAKGGGEFACPVQGRAGVFDRVEMVFMGTGISESGSPPLMVVEGQCRPGKDLNQMRTIWIPMDTILRSAAHDQELQIFEDQPVTVRLQQIPGQWPENWVLKSVKLFRDGNREDSMMVDSAQVREAAPKMLSFNWVRKTQ